MVIRGKDLKGNIHGSLNLSDSEHSEIIFCYTGVNNRHEAKTIYVEPPLKEIKFLDSKEVER